MQPKVVLHFVMPLHYERALQKTLGRLLKSQMYIHPVYRSLIKPFVARVAATGTDRLSGDPTCLQYVLSDPFLFW